MGEGGEPERKRTGKRDRERKQERDRETKSAITTHDDGLCAPGDVE